MLQFQEYSPFIHNNFIIKASKTVLTDRDRVYNVIQDKSLENGKVSSNINPVTSEQCLVTQAGHSFKHLACNE